MNAKFIFIVVFCSFMLGCIFTGAAEYFFIYRPTTEQYRTDLELSRSDTARYRDLYTSSKFEIEGIRRELKTSQSEIERISELLNNSAEQLSGTIGSIQQARGQIQQIINILQQIREELKN